MRPGPRSCGATADEPPVTPELAERVLGWLSERSAEMLALLVQLARLESPSHEAAAQAPVFELLARPLEELGFTTRRLRGRSSGGSLFARPRQRAPGRGLQLLLGHADTVWPTGTLARMPVVLEQGRLRGPGVYDMKGGLTQMLFALRALRALGLEPPLVPLVFVNSDEETGSAESRRPIERLARCVRRVFVLEPSLGLQGRLKTTRKGVGRFSVVVQGRAAHAGLDPESGVSAILELSHVIQRLFALNDPARGVSVNVGVVAGGLRPNVIAPEARALVDVRVPTPADAARVEAAVRGLAPVTPGAGLRVEGGIGRPPLEPTAANRALFELAQRTGRLLGLALQEAAAGGGSDGNFTSRFAPTLDGLGAVGDGAHAEHEFVLVEKLVERAALLALLLLAPASQPSTTENN